MTVPVKAKYTDLQAFIDDAHESVSLHDLTVDIGIFKKDDFRGDLTKCCFHEDDTPSLQVSDHFFRCYAGSCGVKGDIFKFFQVYYRVDFMDAVKKVADAVGADISECTKGYRSMGHSLSDEWNGYLKAMDRAPAEAQAMRRDFFPAEIGYDPKLKYVVLPLKGKTGNILGFTKRRVDALAKKEENGKFVVPKWQHSSMKASLIAQCHNLYNLYEGSMAIRKAKKAMLCEGPKDVIAWQRVGIDWVVGVCGTSNSNNVWDLILPVDEVYLCMDGDEVGVGTVVSNVCYLAEQHDISRVQCISLPEGMDPYDVLEHYGSQGLLDTLRNPCPALQFAAERGSRQEMQRIWQGVPSYQQAKVLSAVCKVKGWSVRQAEDWLMGSERVETSVEIDEKQELLNLVTGKESRLHMMPDKARSILRMKYGIKGV